MSKFSPQAGGGFFAIGGHIKKLSKQTIDNDGNPEPLFLSAIQSNFSTSITWADWTRILAEFQQLLLSKPAIMHLQFLWEISMEMEMMIL